MCGNSSVVLRVPLSDPRCARAISPTRGENEEEDVSYTNAIYHVEGGQQNLLFAAEAAAFFDLAVEGTGGVLA